MSTPTVSIRLIYPLHGLVGTQERYAILPVDAADERFQLSTCSNPTQVEIGIARIQGEELRLLEPAPDKADVILRESDITGFLGLYVQMPFSDFERPLFDVVAEAIVVHRNVMSLLRVVEPDGYVVDPESVCIYTLEYQDGRFVGPPGQIPGPYRMGPWILNDPMHLTADVVDALQRYLLILLDSRASPGAAFDPVVSEPLYSFSRSRAPWLDVGQRLSFTCSALEALFGRWSDKVGGAAFETRVASALSLHGDVGDLEQFLHDDVRQLRNRVAHGKPIGDSATETYEHVRLVAAASILAFYEWYAKRDGSGTLVEWNRSLTRPRRHRLPRLAKGR